MWRTSGVLAARIDELDALTLILDRGAKFFQPPFLHLFLEVSTVEVNVTAWSPARARFLFLLSSLPRVIVRFCRVVADY